jgi:hypothetical protein
MLFAVAQSVGSGISLVSDANAYAASPSAQQPGSTVFQDEDNDDAEDDDSADDDNDDAEDDADDDNDDAADEDDDNAEGDDSADDDNVEDDGSADDDTNDDGDVADAPSINDDALKQPLQQASGTSNGTDATVATPGERVALRMFSWMPSGVAVTIRPVDPNTVTAAPGTRAGDLMFVLEAKDASGTQLSTLPAEANLAIRYADDTVAGLNEGNLTLSRLDPTTNQWQPAPKLVREPDSNYVAASVMDLGTYVVSAP